MSAFNNGTDEKMGKQEKPEPQEDESSIQLTFEMYGDTNLDEAPIIPPLARFCDACNAFLGKLIEVKILTGSLDIRREM